MKKVKISYQHHIPAVASKSCPRQVSGTIKTIFIFYFMMMMVLYAFFDDGGITSKMWYDYLFMPIPSIGFAAFFTVTTCLGIYIFRFLFERLKGFVLK